MSKINSIVTVPIKDAVVGAVMTAPSAIAISNRAVRLAQLVVGIMVKIK